MAHPPTTASLHIGQQDGKEYFVGGYHDRDADGCRDYEILDDLNWNKSDGKKTEGICQKRDTTGYEEFDKAIGGSGLTIGRIPLSTKSTLRG